MRTVARFRLLNRTSGKDITGVSITPPPNPPLPNPPTPVQPLKPLDDRNAANLAVPAPITNLHVHVDTACPGAFDATVLLPGVAVLEEVLAVLGPQPYSTADSLWLRVSYLDGNNQLCYVITPGVSPFYIG